MSLIPLDCIECHIFPFAFDNVSEAVFLPLVCKKFKNLLTKNSFWIPFLQSKRYLFIEFIEKQLPFKSVALKKCFNEKYDERTLLEFVGIRNAIGLFCGDSSSPSVVPPAPPVTNNPSSVFRSLLDSLMERRASEAKLSSEVPEVEQTTETEDVAADKFPCGFIEDFRVAEEGKFVFSVIECKPGSGTRTDCCIFASVLDGRRDGEGVSFYASGNCYYGGYKVTSLHSSLFDSFQSLVVADLILILFVLIKCSEVWFCFH